MRQHLALLCRTGCRESHLILGPCVAASGSTAFDVLVGSDVQRSPFLIPAPCVCLLGVCLMQVLSIVLSDSFSPVETSSRSCKRPDPAADGGAYKSGNRQTVSGKVRK